MGDLVKRAARKKRAIAELVAKISESESRGDDREPGGFSRATRWIPFATDR